MKKFILIIFAIAGFIPAFSGELEAYFMFSKFNSPEGPYIETSISTIGSSAVFVKNEKGTFNAQIEITMVFYKNNEIVTFRKYNLTSPEVNDTIAVKPNFLDIQRIPLANGIYNIELSIRDLNSQSKAFNLADIVNIDYSQTKLEFSSFQYIESYKASTEQTLITKHGYEMVPYISDFFPKNIDKLTFYCEMYNLISITKESVLLTYYIERFEDSKKYDAFSSFKKLEPQQYNVFIGEFNITDLYSGNYNIVVEIRNRNNELIGSQKTFFQRSKESPIADINHANEIVLEFTGITSNTDSLKMYVQSLRPIANNNECNFIDYQAKKADYITTYNFFLGFWLKRNSGDPNSEWEIYKSQVDYVNKWLTTSIRKGFETDRGRVYLKYGTPDDIYQSSHEPSAYPYEIWKFNKVGDETNRRFVFYNPSLTGEEYELLHSDVTGELRNPNWERLLSKRNNTIYNFDQNNSDGQWGSRAQDEYNKR